MKKKFLLILLIIMISLTGCGKKKVNKNIQNNCKFDGELVQGAEYVNGQYTYHYKEQHHGYDNTWDSISEDGWGVALTDKESTDPVMTKLCSSINGKPIVSMSNMFYSSNATSIDLSSFNTSQVINMEYMFAFSKVASLDLSNFDTSKVTDMSDMFCYSQVTSLDLSSFDTSKVTDMRDMFEKSKVININLSSFNTSNVEYMEEMFANSSVESLDVSNFDVSTASKYGFYNMKKMFCNTPALKNGQINYGENPERFGNVEACGLFD